jgi:hypothetical protein
MESDASEEKCKETAGFYVNIFLEIVLCHMVSTLTQNAVNASSLRLPAMIYGLNRCGIAKHSRFGAIQWRGRPKRSRSRKNSNFFVPLIQQYKLKLGDGVTV